MWLTWSMFRTEPHADKPCRDSPQYRKPLQQPHRERDLHLPAMVERPSQKLILNRELASLNHTRRQLAPALNTPQVVVRQAAGPERRRQNVGRSNRILNRQVDSDAADGRHRMLGRDLSGASFPESGYTGAWHGTSHHGVRRAAARP